MLWTAFILGLFGSLHCVGMCAPLALALPYSRAQRFQMLGETLLYNGGRIVTYSIQGLLFGFLGKGLALAGLQQSLSVLFGLIFIVVALFSLGFNAKIYSTSFFQHFTNRIRTAFGKAMRHRQSFFLMGILNGLLPCGMVYWAIAGSLLTFSVWEGSVYMLLFGLGTVPLMAGSVMLSSVVKRSVIQRFYQLIPVYQLALGVFLIYRAYLIDPSVLWMLTPAPMCH